jgi:hypothetical protein
VTGAVLTGLVAALVTVGGAIVAHPPEPLADHPAPAAAPQESSDHPALSTVWRPR